MIKLDQSGLTLIEMMISMAISSFIIMALLTITTTHLGIANASSAKVNLNSDLIFLGEFFSREIPNAGGEALPLWSAIAVENNCSLRGTLPNCAGSDRLTVVSPENYVGCKILSRTGSVLKIENTPGNPCCLDTIDVLNSHVMLTKGDEFGQKYINKIDKAACTVTMIDGPIAFHDSAPSAYDWAGAILSVINIRTYYLDQNAKELNRRQYVNHGTSDSDIVDSALADRILDFQIAEGYDLDPADGVINDTNDNKDEWLYNDPGSSEAFGSGVFASVSPSSLRMIAVGFAMGSPSTNPIYSHQTQILDGKLIQDPTMMIDSVTPKLLLRSLRDFQ